MVKVLITSNLEKKIDKIFKKESIEVFSLLLSLEDNPKKGKEIANVGNIIIKELKYKSFRFYFITDEYKIKFLKTEELKNLIIKFAQMSDKNSQQKIIDEIKNVLRNLGEEGF